MQGMEAACAAYRRNPKNSFFPTPGKLLELCADDIRERKRAIMAIDKAAHALTQGLAAAPERVVPLPSVDEVLRKHGHAEPFTVVPKAPSVLDIEPQPITDELRNSPLVRKQA